MAPNFTDSIVFFATEVAALAMAARNGGNDEGFVAAPAKGRPGNFVVEVRDTEDNFLLGYL